jgi:uncharacterized protein YdeI (YjbR/CyaY-like superfamily)
MGTNEKEIDAYISRSAAFAQPILKHVRRLVHKGCPEVVEELKWGFPHFEYHGILCSMAAFKKHCAFGFWKASLMEDPHKLLSRMGKTAMGNFGRIERRTDLPSDRVMLDYIKEAVRLNKEGVKIARKRFTGTRELEVPAYFMAALEKNMRALKTFEGFSFSHRKEYVEWITEAKTEETRKKRMASAIEMLADGKSRHWKYERK